MSARSYAVSDSTTCDDGAYDELGDLAISDWPAIYLRAEINYADLQFHASKDAIDWQPIGPLLDASKLSDDYGQGWHFTGAFIGLAVQDIATQSATADFDYFALRTNREGATP